MKTLRLYFFFLAVLGTSFYSFNSGPTCHEIIDKMVSSVSEVKGLKYNLKLIERTGKKFNFFGSSVKLNRVPRKLYLNANGIEVLYIQGKHGGDALVNPNAFPYINLYLDPNGSLMRQDQHHTINEIGFDYFGSVIEASAKKVGDKFDHFFILEGEEMVNNRLSYKIIIHNNDFGYLDYTVKKGENLVTIARKLFVGEYMILEANKGKVDDYKDVKEGKVIKVPSAYAKNVLLYVDKVSFLPIAVRVFDDQGLFEQYDYYNLQLNPKFEDVEFTKDYKDYGF